MAVVARKVLERRQDGRLPIRIEVEYGTLDDFLEDYSMNISVGGMFICTDAPLEADTLFRLRFTLPGQDLPVDCTAKVCWVAAPPQPGGLVAGMGISFEEFSPADKRRIEAWINAQAARPAGVVDLPRQKTV